MPVRGGGFTQGYNIQNMPSEDELFIATEHTDEQADCPSFEPMLAKAQEAAAPIAAPPRPRRRPRRRPGAGRHRAGAGRCRVLLRSQPHLPRPGPEIPA